MTWDLAIELAGTALQTLSIALTAALAILGLHAWRRQIVGKRKMEIAEEVLAAFYRFQDTLAWLRSPMGFSNEATDRRRAPNESAAVAAIKDAYFVPLARLQQTEADVEELSQLIYLARIYFGPDVEKPFDELRAVLLEVMISARMLMEVADAEVDESLRKQLEAAIWDINETEPDSLSQRVAAATAHIERICAKAVDRQPTAQILNDAACDKARAPFTCAR